MQDAGALTRPRVHELEAEARNSRLRPRPTRDADAIAQAVEKADAGA